MEQQHFSIRKRTLDFDDVMNKQREIIYQLRLDALISEQPQDVLFGVVEQAVSNEIQSCAAYGERKKDGVLFDTARLIAYLNDTFPLEFKAEDLTSGLENGKLTDADKLTLQLIERIEQVYVDSHADLPEDQLAYLERHTVLEAIDRLWQEHLYAMDQLRSNMSLRVYAQKDPLVEYKHEAYGIFKSMMDQIYKDVAYNLFRVTITRLSDFEDLQNSMPQEMIHQIFGQFDGNFPGALPEEEAPVEMPVEAEPQVTFYREMPKIGRNDPCPCGSGKKFKNCCGKNS